MKHFMLLGGLTALCLIAASGDAARAAEAPVVIGLEAPFSPPGDPVLGQLIRRGAELGIEYVNTVKGGVLGGRKVELAVEDEQGRAEAAVAGYRRLVSEAHAVAVTGFVHSSSILAANEVAKELGVATIATYTGAEDVTAKHYAIAFRTHAIDPIRAAVWLDFMVKKGFKRISMVAETTDFGLGLLKETEEQNKARKLGLEIQAVTFDHNVTDLTPQLLQIKAFKPDLVVNVAVGNLIDIMINQATTLGILPATPMLISYDQPVRPQFWKLHPENGAGIYFIVYYSPKQALSEPGRWFAQHYEEKYKEPTVYAGLNGFGDVIIIAEAVEQAKSADPAAVVTALERGKFTGWSAGEVTFPQADGVYWHNWSPPVLILHYTKPGEDWREAEVAYAPPAP
ncbi:MAG: ABC transporter substrate-binding protein [Alphaproteobacteria bacterium]